MPHVHFHLLPRQLTGDRFAGRNDDVYPALETAEGSLSSELQDGQAQVSRHKPLKVDADDERVPRSMEDMEKEATWLRGFFDPEPHN